MRINRHMLCVSSLLLLGLMWSQLHLLVKLWERLFQQGDQMILDGILSLSRMAMSRLMLRCRRKKRTRFLTALRLLH
nr:Inosine triphosphate pyrophosphatase [Ipomoea batatas]